MIKQTNKSDKRTNMAKTVVIRKKKGAAKTVKKAKELTRLGSALRALGGFGGGAIGSMIGMPSGGSSLGTSLGASLSKWLGSGDYNVNANSIVNNSLKGSSSIPSMHNNGQSVVVRHKEFVTEVRGKTSFTVRNSFDLNPGRAETFPWLAGVASRFQEYRIKGLVWHYVPSSGAAVSGTNAALGTVMLQTSYRSNDAPPANKNEVLNEYWSSESVPSEPFCHPIECDPKENPFNVQYVRTDVVPAGDSKLLYDLGQTHLCVSGQQADDTVLGDLWCTYEIELKKPIVDSNVTSPYKVTKLTYTGIMSSSTYFNGVEVQQGNLDCHASVKTLTFAPDVVGDFQVVMTIDPTTNFTVCDMSGSPTLANCEQLLLPDGANYWRTVLGGAGGNVNKAFYVTAVRIANKSLTATITFPGSFTGLSTKSMITITPYL